MAGPTLLVSAGIAEPYHTLTPRGRFAADTQWSAGRLGRRPNAPGYPTTDIRTSGCAPDVRPAREESCW